ncbi:MAG TPA: hypothetical protein VK153_00585, partial [Candidatus Paceibacterota bacterium]|nr:hypothetical protein [Candidatus Paceibacterota bacterium]
LPVVGQDNNEWGTILNEYLEVEHNTDGTQKDIASAKVTADPFQTPVFANPLVLDATTHKDFKCGLITGNTTINLTNASDGDAGMIEVIIDSTGGYTVTLEPTVFTKDIGGVALDTTANADNFIGWRKVGTDHIVYNIVQVQ